MGTTLEITYVASCSLIESETLLIKSKEILDRHEAAASLYQPQSELRRLNRDGILKNPSTELLGALELAIEFARRTEGAFDPTVLPVLNGIREKIEKTGRPPTPSQIARWRSKVDYRAIQIQRSPEVWVRIPRGVEITLDGIMKGYAVDRVAEFLLEQGVSNFVVNFSGNMRLEGGPLGGGRWRIEVDDPAGLETQSLPEGVRAVASSSPQFQKFTNDSRWHHLIDPKTLKPANRWRSVTVYGTSAGVCDALSTAAFVGARQGNQDLKRWAGPEYEGVFLPSQLP